VFPPTVGATWQWTLDEPVTGNTIAVGGGAPYPSTPIARKATVASVDEEITVPAGTFSTVHLRIEITEGNRMSPNRIEHAWYAPGVGLVKTTRETSNTRNPAIMTLDELTLFTPGKAMLDWELQLPTALAKHPELADRGMPDDFEPIALGDVALILESRFAIARWLGEDVVLRFGGDRLSVFDRADLEDWTELIAEEPLCAFSTGSLPQASTAALAELAGRLYAVQSGFEVIGSLQVETVNLSRGRRLIQGSLTIRSSTGERTITCRAVVDGGRAIEVSIR
jgi:hypothetical protein